MIIIYFFISQVNKIIQKKFNLHIDNKPFLVYYNDIENKSIIGADEADQKGKL